MPRYTYERLASGQPTGDIREFVLPSALAREHISRDHSRWRRRLDIDMATVAGPPPGAYPRFLPGYSTTPDRVAEYQRDNPQFRYASDGRCYADNSSSLKAGVRAKGHEDLSDSFHNGPVKSSSRTKITARKRSKKRVSRRL